MRLIGVAGKCGGERRIGLAPLSAYQTFYIRLANSAQRNARLDGADLIPVILAPVRHARFPGDPHAVRRIHGNRGPCFELWRGGDGHFGAIEFAVAHGGDEHVIVAVLVAVIGDPGCSLPVDGHGGLPVIDRAIGDAHVGRPLRAVKRLEKYIAVLAAKALPDYGELALTIRRHARIDIRQRILGQTLERAPLLLSGIEPARVDVPIAVHLLRPDYPDAIGRIDGHLRQETIAAGSRHPLQIAPFAAAIVADDDIVAVADKAQPRDPQRAVGSGGDAGPVILAELVSDGGGADLRP